MKAAKPGASRPSKPVVGVSLPESRSSSPGTSRKSSMSPRRVEPAAPAPAPLSLDPVAQANDILLALIRQKNAGELKAFVRSRSAALDGRIQELTSLLASQAGAGSTPTLPSTVASTRGTVTTAAQGVSARELSSAGDGAARMDAAYTTGGAGAHVAAPLTVAASAPQPPSTVVLAPPPPRREETSAVTVKLPISAVPSPAPAPVDEALHGVVVASTGALPASAATSATLPVTAAAAVASAQPPSTASSISDSVSQFLRAVRSAVVSGADSGSPAEAVTRVFRDFDDGGSGAVSESVFQDALMLLGYDLRPSELPLAIAAFPHTQATATRGGAAIDYRSFVGALFNGGELATPSAAVTAATPIGAIASVEQRTGHPVEAPALVAPVTAGQAAASHTAGTGASTSSSTVQPSTAIQPVAALTLPHATSGVAAGAGAVESVHSAAAAATAMIPTSTNADASTPSVPPAASGHSASVSQPHTTTTDTTTHSAPAEGATAAPAAAPVTSELHKPAQAGTPGTTNDSVVAPATTAATAAVPNATGEPTVVHSAPVATGTTTSSASGACASTGDGASAAAAHTSAHSTDAAAATVGDALAPTPAVARTTAAEASVIASLPTSASLQPVISGTGVSAPIASTSGTTASSSSLPPLPRVPSAGTVTKPPPTTKADAGGNPAGSSAASDGGGASVGVSLPGTPDVSGSRRSSIMPLAHPVSHPAYTGGVLSGPVFQAVPTMIDIMGQLTAVTILVPAELRRPDGAQGVGTTASLPASTTTASLPLANSLASTAPLGATRLTALADSDAHRLMSAASAGPQSLSQRVVSDNQAVQNIRRVLREHTDIKGDLPACDAAFADELEGLKHRFAKLRHECDGLSSPLPSPPSSSAAATPAQPHEAAQQPGASAKKVFTSPSTAIPTRTALVDALNASVPVSDAPAATPGLAMPSIASAVEPSYSGLQRVPTAATWQSCHSRVCALPCSDTPAGAMASMRTAWCELAYRKSYTFSVITAQQTVAQPDTTTPAAVTSRPVARADDTHDSPAVSVDKPADATVATSTPPRAATILPAATAEPVPDTSAVLRPHDDAAAVHTAIVHPVSGTTAAATPATSSANTGDATAKQPERATAGTATSQLNEPTTHTPVAEDGKGSDKVVDSVRATSTTGPADARISPLRDSSGHTHEGPLEHVTSTEPAIVASAPCTPPSSTLPAAVPPERVQAAISESAPATSEPHSASSAIPAAASNLVAETLVNAASAPSTTPAANTAPPAIASRSSTPPSGAVGASSASVPSATAVASVPDVTNPAAAVPTATASVSGTVAAPTPAVSAVTSQPIARRVDFTAGDHASEATVPAALVSAVAAFGPTVQKATAPPAPAPPQSSTMAHRSGGAASPTRNTRGVSASDAVRASAGGGLAVVGHAVDKPTGRRSHATSTNPWDVAAARLPAAAPAAAPAQPVPAGGVSSSKESDAPAAEATAPRITGLMSHDASTVTELFPRMGMNEVRLRNLVREALLKKLDAVGLGDTKSLLATGGSGDASAAHTAALSEALSPPAVEALTLAFERYRDSPARGAYRRAPPALVSFTCFARAIDSLGVQGLGPDDVSAAIGALDVGSGDRVAYERFVRFVAMPLVPEDQVRVAARAATAAAGGMAGGTMRAPRVVALVEADDTGSSAKASPVRRSGGVSGVGAVSPLLARPSAWDLAGDDPAVARRKPKFSVSTPIAFSSMTSPFWTVVNGLEAAVMAEVRRRATVSSLAPEPSAKFEVTARYGTTGVHATSGAFILRRAFAFFDRRTAKEFTLADFHATLADLGLVDLPLRLHSGLATADAAGDATSPHRPFTPQAAARRALVDDADGLSSPSHRLLPDVTPVGATGEGFRPGGLSPGGSSRPTTPNLEAQLAAAGHHLAAAVYRRLHGEGDPGVAAAAEVTSGLTAAEFDDSNPVLCKPVTFNTFAQWAAPLNGRLRKVREKVEEALRTLATMGGGAKDFVRAFKRMTGGHRATDVLGIPQLRDVLGVAARTLSDEEVQCLIDYFDADGSGRIDAVELFSATVRGRDLRELLAGCADDDYVPPDRYVGGPVTSPSRGTTTKVVFGSTTQTHAPT